MSDNVLSSGFMAPLIVPMDEVAREERSEELYESGSSLHINYDGTIIRSEETDDPYGLFIQSNKSQSAESFLLELEKEGIRVDETKIRSYNCVWYNGADSDMDMLTLEEYLEKI